MHPHGSDRTGVARALVCAALAFLPISPFAQEPSFRSSSADLVVLPVLVTDRPDHFVSDLDRDQFTVFDNGRRVPIEFFSNEDTPVTVGLAIDSSGSMQRKLGHVIAAALAFAQS